jgi:trehalose utilization protein
MLQVTVWNEYLHELQDPAIGKIYPDGIHGAIAQGIAAPDLNIRTATLKQPQHGLPTEILDETDVLIWWGHMAHEEVACRRGKRLQPRPRGHGLDRPPFGTCL